MSNISKIRKISQYLPNLNKKRLLIISSLMLFFMLMPILISHNGSTNYVTTNSTNQTNSLSPKHSDLPTGLQNNTLYIEPANVSNVIEGSSINLSVLLFYVNNSNFDPCNQSYKVSWTITNATINFTENGNLTWQFGNLFETQVILGNPTNSSYLYPSNYSIVYTATGNGFQPKTSNQINFTIYSKGFSQLISPKLPDTLIKGQTLTLTYQLYCPNSSTSKSIEGLPIIFTFDYGTSKQTYTYYTDSDGNVTVKYQIPSIGVGWSLTLKVEFPGTKNINSTSTIQSIPISPQIGTNLNFQSVEKGKLITGVYSYSVNLTDSENQPLSGMNVTFEVVNSYGAVIEERSGSTDVSGTSSVSLNLNEVGTFEILVLYTGKDIYAPATPLNASVQVMTTLTMVLQQMPKVAIILGIIIVGIVVYQRAYLVPKRKRRLESLKIMHQKFTDAENIQYILILTRDGLAIFSRSFTNIPIDGNLISGFLSAISSFGTQLGAQMKNKKASIIDKGLEELSYQQFKIIVNDATLVRTAVLLRKNASDTLKDNIKRFNYKFQEDYLDKLKNYDGEVLDELPILDLIEKNLELDLLYPHNINSSKIKDYTYGLSIKSIKRRILRQAQRPPFHNTFYIRDMIDYFVEKDLSESTIFNEIIDLRTDGVIFAVNPIIQSLMEQFETVIEKLSPEAKNVIKTLKEGKFSIQGIKNVESAIKELQDLRLVDAKNELTDAGESLGSLLKIL